MRKLAFAMLIVFGASLNGWAQKPEEKKDDGAKPMPKIYATGYQAPDPAVKKAVIHRTGWVTFPHTAAPSWDCRKLGLVPPIVNQANCLPAGTMVLMKDGTSKRIEEVRIGDRVETRNGFSGNVTSLSHRPSAEVNRIRTNGESKQDDYLYFIEVGGHLLMATRDEEVLATTGYTRIVDIGVGDLVTVQTSRGPSWEKVTRAGMDVYDKSAWLYDVVVEGSHCFVANSIWVHNCGSCWCFAGAGATTSAMIKAGYGKPDGVFRMSEQYVLDCGRNGGCNGDDHSSVFNMAKSGGLISTADYGAYRATEGRCKDTASFKKYVISDWGYCDPHANGAASTQSIKDSMVQYGPISVAIAADNRFMNIAAGSVFSGNSRNINHEVILVGWDDAKGKAGAWLLRNSWDVSWAGDGTPDGGGYCWIEYGANGVGTDAAWVTVAPLPPPPDAPHITSALTATGGLGLPFSYQITATGSPTAFGATNLPDGLSVSNTTGMISGTPKVIGSFNVTLSASSSPVTPATAVLVLTIVSPQPPPGPGIPQITSVLSAAGSVGDSFSYQITASHQPTSFGAAGLPPGLAIDASGAITGVPTLVGTSSVIVSATNAVGAGVASLSITISATPGPLPGDVTLKLTAEQVQSVFDQAGVVEITPGMTVKELAEILSKASRQGTKNVKVQMKAMAATTVEVAAPPVDSMQASLAAAYAKDTDPDKAASVSFLAALYKTVGAEANAGKFKVQGDYMKTIKAAEAVPLVGLAPTAIPSVRAAVAIEVSKTLNPANAAAPLTQSVRDQVGSLFNKLALTLQSISAKK